MALFTMGNGGRMENPEIRNPETEPEPESGSGTGTGTGIRNK